MLNYLLEPLKSLLKGSIELINKRMTTKEYLQKTNISPKRARQHFKADLNKFSKELNELEISYCPDDYLVNEIKDDIQETMIHLINLEKIIKDKIAKS